MSARAGSCCKKRKRIKKKPHPKPRPSVGKINSNTPHPSISSHGPVYYTILYYTILYYIINYSTLLYYLLCPYSTITVVLSLLGGAEPHKTIHSFIEPFVVGKIKCVFFFVSAQIAPCIMKLTHGTPETHSRNPWGSIEPKLGTTEQ